MGNSLKSIQDLGQSVWLDYIRREMLTSGQFDDYLTMGITGVTSNPTIFEKAIVGSTDYDQALLELARTGKTTEQIYESLAIEDIRGAADKLRPIYDRTDGRDGYVSFEVNPLLAYDAEGTIAEAKRLFTAVDRVNLMIKVPATNEGIPAIRQLIGSGLNINITLIFSLEMYTRVREAHIAGLKDLIASGGDPGRIASVASFFVSRVDTAVDQALDEYIDK